MGDSIVKHVGGYELSRKVENCKVYVKSFSGAKVMCMEDYVKATLREMPTHIILHVWMNDVLTKKAPEQIAENIANSAIKLKRNCDASISSITARNDQYQKKAVDVNRELKEKCREKNLQFLNHRNTITVRHLNASKFRLNKRGTQVLSIVFAEAISNINNWQFVLHSLASDNIRNTNDYDENKAKFKVGAISASNLNAIRKRYINRLIIGQPKYKFPEK